MKKTMTMKKLNKYFGDKVEGKELLYKKGTTGFEVTINGFDEEEAQEKMNCFIEMLEEINIDYNKCPSVIENEYSDTFSVEDEDIEDVKKIWKQFKKIK